MAVIDWYKGDVASAVADAKKQCKSLMVFVVSDDEYTKLYNSILLKLDYSGKSFLPLKIEAYTEAYEFLKAIYKIVPVPCVLVIDWESGMVMERVAGPYFDEELQESLIAALQDAPVVKETPPKVEPVVQQTGKEESLPSASTNKAPVTKQREEPEAHKISQINIQLKLESESKTHMFAPDDTLASVRRQAAVLFNLQRGFELAIPYPRRILPLSEDSTKLEDMQMGAGFSILVIPNANATTLFRNLPLFLQPFFNYLASWWRYIFPSTTPSTTNINIKKNN